MKTHEPQADAGWIRTAGMLATLGAIGWAGLCALGARRWRGLTGELHARLEAGRQPPAPSRYDAAELGALPAPVARYFRAALTDGQPVVAAARLTHTGRFNLGETADRWKPFTSTERLVTREPGFVWDGRVSVLPGLAIRVHDAYLGGGGLLRAAPLGLFNVAQMKDTGMLAQGELMRFLAEAVYYPTALLPSQGVRWERIDEESARATLADRGDAVSLVFRFGGDGLAASVHADARGRMVDGRMVETPWEGRFSEYRRLHGMAVPLRGEVAWLPPEGRKPYWRGRLTGFEVEWASEAA